MDSSLFLHPSGTLVRIDESGALGFLPNALPVNFEVPLGLTRLWADAREIVGELRGIGKTLPDHALLTRPLRQREALRSSSLEGTFASPEELLAYERDPRDPTSRTDPVNAWLEVFNYQKALDFGQKHVSEGYPFSEWLIRQLHQVLLTGVRGDDKSPGELRVGQVHIGAGNRFTPPPNEHLSALMGQLERELQADDSTDPLIKCFLIHYQFETIHPFRDGNGRVGRLLLALMIYKYCDFDMPWLYLSEYFERFKDEYINNLFNISALGAFDRWIEFCLLATISVGRSTIKRIERLLSLKLVYEGRIRQVEGRDRLLHILPRLFSSPTLRYSDLQTVLSISYPTARADMEALLALKIVSELKSSMGNARTFYAEEIFQIAYRDELPEVPRQMVLGIEG